VKFVTTDTSAVTCQNCRRKIEIANRPARPDQKPVEIVPAASRSFFTKIVGVTFTNGDGARRQQIIARCSAGESLILVRAPDNRFDAGAIKVLRLNGEQLGYLSEHVARGGSSSGLAFQMDRGDIYRCRISSITGGGPGMSLGVNIEIVGGEFDDVPSLHSVRADPLPGAPTGLWLFFGFAVVLGVFLIARNC